MAQYLTDTGGRVKVRVLATCFALPHSVHWCSSGRNSSTSWAHWHCGVQLWSLLMTDLTCQHLTKSYCCWMKVATHLATGSYWLPWQKWNTIILCCMGKEGQMSTLPYYTTTTTTTTLLERKKESHLPFCSETHKIKSSMCPVNTIPVEESDCHQSLAQRRE